MNDTLLKVRRKKSYELVFRNEAMELINFAALLSNQEITLIDLPHDFASSTDIYSLGQIIDSIFQP